MRRSQTLLHPVLSMITASWHRQLLALVVFVALGGAQLFGLSRGYLCDCGGGFEFTAFNHCHGPHAVQDHDHGHDHEDAEPHHRHHEEGDLPDDHDTHHHAPATELMLALEGTAKNLAAGVSATPMVITCEALHLPKAFEAPPLVRAAFLRDEGGGRRWPRMLAHSIALRV